MRYVRYFFQFLSGIIFHIALMVAVSLVCFSFVAGDRRDVKNVLDASKVYDSAVPAFLETSAKYAPDNALPLDDPDIVAITTNVFNEQLLREKTELMLDDVYDWLEGETSVLSFKLDVGQQRTEFIDQIALYSVSKFNALPVCESVQFGEVNIYSASCRPRGNIQPDLYDTVRNDIIASDFLSKTVFTEADLPLTSDGRAIAETYAYVPRIFQIASNGLLWGVMLLCISGLFYVASRPSLRRGVQALGRDLVSNGFFLVVSVWVFVFVLPEYFVSFNLQTDSLTMMANNLNEILSKRIAYIVIIVEIVLVIVGLSFIILEKLSRPHSLYGAVGRKSGITTSLPQSTKRNVKASKAPPIQTSEDTPARRITKKKKSKYRKLGI